MVKMEVMIIKIIVVLTVMTRMIVMMVIMPRNSLYLWGPLLAPGHCSNGLHRWGSIYFLCLFANINSVWKSHTTHILLPGPGA